MQKSVLVLTTVMVLFGSCSDKMSPETYNERVVKLHAESFNYLHPRMEQIFDFQNTSKEQATQIVDSLNARFADCLKELDEMKYPDKAADWHKVTTQLFNYVKDSVVALYGETLKLEPESEEWNQVWNEIVRRLKDRADEIEDRMIAEQQKFANTVGKRLQR
jgi:hypothetical protein